MKNKKLVRGAAIGGALALTAGLLAAPTAALAAAPDPLPAPQAPQLLFDEPFENEPAAAAFGLVKPQVVV